MRSPKLAPAVLAIVSLVLPLGARTRKGDKFLAQGHAAEAHGEMDKALELDENALGEDPSDTLYQLDVRRVRFIAAAQHVKNGQKVRAEGNLSEALVEFQRAYAIDPASPVAQTEIRRTKAMMEREKKKGRAAPSSRRTPSRP